jgi:peptidoglycan/xylan/chitin deacetylase (PgdA/CDA1 family)
MRSLSRLLALALSLAAGSWVGIGEPSVAQMRTAIEGQAVTRAESPRALRAVGPPAAGPLAPPFDPPTAGVDPKLLPEYSPWPRLNAEANPRRAWLLASGPSYASNEGRRLVTFTFDDGPFPETTPVILRMLAQHHVPATFFFIGRYLEGDGDRAVKTRAVAQEVLRAGHAIGNHTRDHRMLVGLSREQIAEQIDHSAATIERTVGHRPAFFRPPFGQLDATGSELLQERNLELVLWNIDAGDMKRDDVGAMTDNLREQIEYEGGGIVLLHDIRWSSVHALGRLLAWLDAHKYDPKRPEALGYEIVDLVTYIRATAASPQPYADRVELETARGLEWRRRHPQRPSILLPELEAKLEFMPR